MDYQLVAVKIGSREDSVSTVQKILTDFGCHIKVRLGLHDLPENACSPMGLVILQVTADQPEIDGFVAKLNKIEDVLAKSITL